MRTLFIDFDGTICHDRFWRSLQSDEIEQVENFLFSGQNSLVTDWMKGAYTAEEINKLVSDKTGLAYEYLWGIFVQDCKTMRVETKLLELINQLRGAFHVVLITGNMDCFNRFTIPSLQLDKYFDVIVNSFDEKQLKTDDGGASFIKHNKGRLHDAILIDDSAKTCATFQTLGGTAYLITHQDDTMQHLRHLLDQ